MNDGLTFVFNKGNLGSYQLVILFDNRVVTRFDKRVSSRVRSLCRTLERGHGVSVLFQEILEHENEEQAHVKVEYEDELLNVSWRGMVTIRSFLNVNLLADDIEVQTCNRAQGSKDHELILIYDMFYLDVPARELVRVEQQFEEREFSAVLDRFLAHFKLTTKQYNHYHLFSSHSDTFFTYLECYPFHESKLELEAILLTKKGHAESSSLIDFPICFSVSLVPNMDVVYLRWILNAPNGKVPCVSVFFVRCVAYFRDHTKIIQDHISADLEPFLRDHLCNENEIDLGRFVAAYEHSHSQWNDESIHFFQFAIDELEQELDRLYVNNASWVKKSGIRNDLCMLFMYFVLRPIIQGEKGILSLNEAMLVPKLYKDTVLSHFKILDQLGIEVRIDDKPVEMIDPFAEIELSHSTDNDFLLDMNMSSDQFEILSSPNWFEDFSMMKRDDGYVVMDPEKRDIWQSIIRMLKQDETGRLTQKELSQLDVLRIMGLAERLDLKIQLDDKLTHLHRVLIKRDELPKVGISELFQGNLREYQMSGYEWLSVLYRFGLGGCLADEMGLGKTVQVICFLAGVYEGIIKQVGQPEKVIQNQAPFLIVVPASLLYNWKHEFASFYPAFSVSIMGEDEFHWDVDVVVVSYDRFRRNLELFLERDFYVVVFDEAQVIKNRLSARSKAANLLKARCKLAVTGTPLENHIDEFKTILGTVVPSLFSDKDDTVHSVKSKSKPFVLRRMKRDVLDDVGELIIRDMMLNLSPEQRSVYDELVLLARHQMVELKQMDGTKYAQVRMKVLTLLTRLRQVCLASELIVDAKPSSPKTDYLADQIPFLLEEDESVLIFSQFTSYLDIIEARFVADGIPILRLDGSTPIPKRNQLINTFQESEKPCVFLLSLKAGGFGLNLTKASYIFLCDPWWNPAVEQQAFARAHRIGQKKTVIVTRLYMAPSIEEKIQELQKKKQALFDEVVGDDLADTRISLNDLEFILG